MICPECVGMCSVEQIELIETLYDDKELFFCPKCKRFSELKIIDEEYLEAEELADFRNIRNKLSKDAISGGKE